MRRQKKTHNFSGNFQGMSYVWFTRRARLWIFDSLPVLASGRLTWIYLSGVSERDASVSCSLSQASGGTR